MAKNSIFALLSQICNILLNFISRTIFINMLGIEYLGINGLFTNILMLLSFAELGIGNAIIYGMYKPLAIKDNEKIKSLMNLYSNAYKIIGSFIFIAGLFIIPFMDFIIKDKPNISENIIYIYILFLLNTALSYFFVYKKSIIIADQKNYIILFYQQIFKILQVLCQIVILYMTKNYIVFLLIQIIFTLSENIYMSKKADYIYPFLKEKNIQKLDTKEKKIIFSNVVALFFYKFGSVILNGTDNIIISAIVGVTAVAINSNYMMIISAITTIVSQFLNGFTATIGNINAIGDEKSKESTFNKIFFISSWIYGFGSIGLLLFLNETITLWIGSKFIFNNLIVFCMILHFYVNGVHFAAYTYRVTMGFFVQGRWTPLIAAILNIILSLWLGNVIGIAGIFLATSIARCFTTGIVDPILIYKKGFNKNPIKYYLKYLLFVLIFIALYILLKFITSYIIIDGIIGLIIKVMLVSILFNLSMFIIFYKNREFKEIRNIILDIIKKK